MFSRREGIFLAHLQGPGGTLLLLLSTSSSYPNENDPSFSEANGTARPEGDCCLNIKAIKMPELREKEPRDFTDSKLV